MFTLLQVLFVAAFGGWAAITVEDLPDYVVARQAINLSFMVRQHGVRPMEDLHPTIEAKSANREVSVASAPGSKIGLYTAHLTIPDPGRWTITIRSGFGNSNVTLLPLLALAPGAPAPALLADAERGRRLFVAKGCVTCHLHRAVNETSIAVGPELTERRFAPEYLTRFLADPASVIPPRAGAPSMPNLGLKPAEIAALTAFLNGGGAEASR